MASTLAKFIEEHGITAEVEWAAENPNMASETPMNHWLVTLKVGDKTMPVPFSQGLGITREPTAADVLDCLASDQSLVAEYGDPIEMAVELGEVIESQSDIDRARDTWGVIEKQGEALRELLGDDATDDLIYETERQ